MKKSIVHYQAVNASVRPEIDRRYYVNYSFGAHFHDKSELVYVSEGELTVTVDGHTETVSAERFCLILPWQTHSFHTEEASRSLILVFPNSLIGSFLRDMEDFRFETQVFEAEAAVLALFLKYLSSGPVPDDYIISGILLSLCHCFYHTGRPYPVRPGDRTSALPEMLIYIATHSSEPMTLRTVAEKLGYSYHHLSHLFNSYVGMGFPQFLNTHRVISSLKALRDTDNAVSEIAFASGFSNVRSFNRCFREVTGMSPGEYRKNPPKSDYFHGASEAPDGFSEKSLPHDASEPSPTKQGAPD